jgi:protein-S-isoprenylcysteine O-methyltransferase Ste14
MSTFPFLSYLYIKIFMHPIPYLIAVYAFILMGIGFFITIFSLLRKKRGVWGTPSVNPFLFYSGKIAIFLCWGLTLMKAIFPSFGWVDVPLWMSWMGAVLLCIGTLVLLISFYDLGASLRYGLPENDTVLKTSGLYRISRNPLYLGVYLITISSIIFFPNFLNICIGLYCIVNQYLMILAEEKFLAIRFGKEWEDYKIKVRRFL